MDDSRTYLLRDESEVAMASVKEQMSAREVTIPLVGARVPLPSGEDLAYYGGLGVLTALEMIEWPVTLAVGAGYALATHHDRRAGEPTAAAPSEKQGGKAR